MPRALSKRVLLARQQFQQSATDYLVSKGALAGSFYQFVMQTQAGVLHVTPYETWIATRFDDPGRARELLGAKYRGWLNPYSGKWNFHFSDDDLDGPFALDYFARHLEPLLTGK